MLLFSWGENGDKKTRVGRGEEREKEKGWGRVGWGWKMERT